ncbi:MAG: twin-arginine translocase subunit TatC [Pseudomonadota bacterium]|nr:twin-arginine translocase subunit TatC [Pseudomonadota bacterium]
MNKSKDNQKMPLLEHLTELRDRLLKSLIAIVVLFFIFFAVKEEIYGFLVAPLAEILSEHGDGRRMIFTALHEAFFTYIKVSFWTALFVSFPFIAAQFWRFVAPGLYASEKKALLPYLILSPILFFLGGALVYYFIFPLAWQFFISFEAAGTPGSLPVQLEPKVNEYLSLVMRLIFAFGLSFQLPIVLTLLARAGLTSSRGLAEKRKYAIVFSFIGAAIITPPDVISQVGLAIPIIVLYEASILAVRMVEKKRGTPMNDYDEPSVEETDFKPT